MTVLGVDPGLAIVGFGVVQSGSGRMRHLRHGVIRTPAGLDLHLRLRTIYEDMTELISAFKPDQLAIEELFFGKNSTTGLPVAHARGVILLAAAQAGLPIYQYKPMQVKQAVVGYGKAEKHQVMEMVRQICALEKVPRPDDAADALAIAICHCNHNGMGV